MRFRVRGLRGGEVEVLALEAESEAAAREAARGRGVSVLSVAGQGWPLRAPGRALRGFPLLVSTQQFVALLDAGLGAAEALEALAGRAGAQGAVLAPVLGHVRAGRSLSYAFEQDPASFPPLFVATVRAAEKTGDMGVALARYADYAMRLERLRRKVAAAAIYPAVLAATGLAVAGFLLFYVVPRFSRIYEEIGGNLPWASRLLMQWGQLLSEHAAALAAAAVAVGFAAWRLGARAAVRERLMRAAWRAPRIGEALRIYHLARFYRTMGMLLRSGMALVSALGMAGGLLAPGMRPALEAARRRVAEGVCASAALEERGLATPVGLSLLRVGERTGELGAMMDRAADFHDDELGRWVEMATRLFEPLLMGVIGILIGVLVVLLYLPVFELANSLQ